MSRDHLLGFPSVLLALDEPVRASQRTGVARIPTPLVDKKRRELDTKLTRELGQTEIAKPAEPRPFQIGDEVYWMPYKKLLPRGVIQRFAIHPTGVLMALTSWYGQNGKLLDEGKEYDTRHMALASAFKE